MFVGWLSYPDGTRLPTFRHIVIRSRLIEDGKYVQSLIVKLDELIYMILWIMCFGVLNTYVSYEYLIPRDLWFPVVALAFLTFSPLIGTMIAYQMYWFNYAREDE